VSRGGAAGKPRWKIWMRRVAFVIGIPAVLGAGVIAWANLAPVWVSRGRLFDDVSRVPVGRVGLVFGCDNRLNGRENLYFRYRMDAAAALWKAGKVSCLILSGDNRSRDYNEPARMRAALVARGVPTSRMVNDYAGLRTLDSVVRAKEVFGVTSITFVTQKFHNERAIYLALANGVDAYGFNAADVPAQRGMKTKLREVGARVLMWLDVCILKTRPRHVGGHLPLPAGV
jgi:SanA protein